MNVALLHYSAPPIVGGVESVLAHQARLMTAAGHSVRVIAARGEPWDERIPFVRIPLVDSRHPAILALKAELDAGRIPPQFETLTSQLTTDLREAARGAEVLLAHNVCSLNKNLALTAALWRLNGAPGFPRLVVWHHDLAWTTSRYRAELHEGHPWDLLRRHWPGATDVAISRSRQYELAELFGMPAERIRVAPNGIDVAAFYQLEAQTLEFVRRLDLLSTAPLLLLPVRITPRKNIELALQMLAHLRRSFPAAALVVTGPVGAHNPANVDYLKRLQVLRQQLGLEHAAHLLGELTDTYLPDAVIADFFRLADALFLPSREEGFGIPLLEAAFSHLPVFCADIAALRELGHDDALYFSPDAEPALVAAQVAQYLQSDSAFRLTSRIRANFTWDQIYRQHIEPLLAEGG